MSLTQLQKILKKIGIGATFLLTVISLFFLSSSVLANSNELISPLPKNIKNQVLAFENKENQKLSSVNFSQKNVNILILGLDGRKGDKNPRCDAIHILSHNPNKQKIVITNIPRGTTIGTPKSDYQGIIANTCHTMGIDYTISSIAKITNINPDYVVKVGFSQALGVLRTIDFPTTPTLQFLRNRKYTIGDNQRSRNQAQFLKDMMIASAQKINQLPRLVKYFLYKTIDTDMPFDTARLLLEKIVTSKILNNPNNIELVTKPDSKTLARELHFAAENYEDPQTWQNNKEFQAYQNNLIGYFSGLITRAEKFIKQNKISSAYQLIKTSFSQQLWLQIEDKKIRSQFHFDLLKIYIITSADMDTAMSYVEDFIREMDSLGLKDYKEKGEKLLKMI